MVSEQLVQDLSLARGENQSELRRRLQLIDEPESAKSPRMRQLCKERAAVEDQANDLDQKIDDQARLETSGIEGKKNEIFRRENDLLKSKMLLSEAREYVDGFAEKFSVMEGKHSPVGLAKFLENTFAHHRSMEDRIKFFPADIARQEAELSGAKSELAKLEQRKSALK